MFKGEVERKHGVGERKAFLVEELRYLTGFDYEEHIWTTENRDRFVDVFGNIHYMNKTQLEEEYFNNQKC